jgi:adenylate cyclase
MMGPVAQEIERKFLVNVAPDPAGLAGATTLRQGYLAIEGPVEVRLREADGTTTLTVKAGRGVARTEVEAELDDADADELWAHVQGRVLDKVRHRVPLSDDAVAELDLYRGPLEGLVTVEVEFPDEASASRFEPPEWFGRELTDEPGWSNASLARHGRPS